MSGENPHLKDILLRWFINEMKTTYKDDLYIRDLDEITAFLATHEDAEHGEPRFFVETNLGAVECNRFVVLPDKLQVRTDRKEGGNYIRNIPHAKNRLQFGWRFFPNQLLFAKEDTESFLMPWYMA